MFNLLFVAADTVPVQPTENGLPWWIVLTSVLVPLLVAGIPAFVGWQASRTNRDAAQLSAEAAEKQAAESRQSTEEIERLRLLERRVSERKTDAYAKFVPAFARLFAPDAKNATAPQKAKTTQALLDASNNFWHESLVYSSDDVQRAFARAMQGAFHDAPPVVTMRLFGELVIAIRLDMWGGSSELTVTDVWAPKIRDLFSYNWSDNVPFHEAATMPFDQLCGIVGWQRPWQNSPLEHRAGEGNEPTS